MKGRKNILLIGNAGREHALACALSGSPHLGKLITTPKNDAISQISQAIKLPNDNNIIKLCQKNNIHLTIIGPEQPLINGLADKLRNANIPTLGPSAKAAKLEASKGFTRDLCAKLKIPAPAYARFQNPNAARQYAQTQKPPIVIKADGIAAGKGVAIAETQTEALRAINRIAEGTFGEKNRDIVIEEFLTGEEASFFVLTDGKSIIPLASAQDHKRLLDGDKGPNTGGMGAYSPAPILTPDIEEQVMAEIIRPALKEMTARGAPYQGVLYAGLMIQNRRAKLIEFNARFGDPECQALMMRLESDLLPLLYDCATGNLGEREISWRSEAALTIVMAAKGYPGAYETNSPIRGIEKAEALDGVRIFHAGTAKTQDGWRAAGGRVLNITALGKTVADAASLAYQAASCIEWKEGHYRRDIGASVIGQRALAREE